MLVLTRKPGESIVIPGCELTVTVLDIQGSKVRLGLEAPPTLKIHRLEVWRRLEGKLVTLSESRTSCVPEC